VGLVERFEFVFDVTGRSEKGELVAVNLVVKLIVGEKSALGVNFRKDRYRFLALREATQGSDAAFVIALDVFARAGDGQLVQELEESRAKFFQQVFGMTFAGLLARPKRESFLRRRQRILQARNADGVLERGVLAFGQEVNLVAEIPQIVVDRRGGEQQDFRFDPALDDVVHEALVTAFADEIAVLVALAGRVGPKVV